MEIQDNCLALKLNLDFWTVLAHFHPFWCILIHSIHWQWLYPIPTFSISTPRRSEGCNTQLGGSWANYIYFSSSEVNDQFCLHLVDLHVQPDVPLLQLPCLGHPRSAGERPCVLLGDVLYEEPVTLYDVLVTWTHQLSTEFKSLNYWTWYSIY